MKETPKKPKDRAPRGGKGNGPARRREQRTRWVQRGQYAVEVVVEVVYPEDDPPKPCLEPATVRRLDEIARKAEQGDLDYVQRVGRVFQLVSR